MDKMQNLQTSFQIEMVFSFLNLKGRLNQLDHRL